MGSAFARGATRLIGGLLIAGIAMAAVSAIATQMMESLIARF